jgi:hypothetical protein
VDTELDPFGRPAARRTWLSRVQVSGANPLLKSIPSPPARLFRAWPAVPAMTLIVRYRHADRAMVVHNQVAGYSDDMSLQTIKTALLSIAFPSFG